MKEQATTSMNTDFGAEGLSDMNILFEIGNMGAGHAASALSDLLHQPVTVELPRLHLTQPHLVPNIYGKHDTVVAAIFMQLHNKLDCDILLLLDLEEAEKIAALMTSAMENSEDDPELKDSTIAELGSIMICSFLNAVADFTLTALIPNPPNLIYDSFDAILDGFLVKQALRSNVALVFDTRFKRSDSSAEGTIILFPSDELIKTLVNSGKKYLESIQPIQENAIEAKANL